MLNQLEMIALKAIDEQNMLAISHIKNNQDNLHDLEMFVNSEGQCGEIDWSEARKLLSAVLLMAKAVDTATGNSQKFVNALLDNQKGK